MCSKNNFQSQEYPPTMLRSFTTRHRTNQCLVLDSKRLTQCLLTVFSNLNKEVRKRNNSRLNQSNMIRLNLTKTKTYKKEVKYKIKSGDLYRVFWHNNQLSSRKNRNFAIPNNLMFKVT
jgi:hypothetical protein